MKINPYKDWIIRSDANNVTLCRSAGFIKTKDSNGNETSEEKEAFKDETYHASVPHALRALCRKELNACQCNTFKGFKAECDKLENLLKEISKELKEGVFYE